MVVKKTFALVLVSAMAFMIFSGCSSLKGDGFAEEEYIWENWKVSTNRIESVDFSF